MASASSVGEVVSRVAWASSDHIISVQRSHGTHSEFSPHLKSLQRNKVSSFVAKNKSPEVEVVRQNADPLLSVHRPAKSGKLVAVTADSSILLHSIPHLYKLAHYPVVLHISLNTASIEDYANITAVRECGFTFIHSESLLEAQNLGLSAHALAVRTGRGVIHFFDSAKLAQDRPIPYEEASLVEELLDTTTVRARQAAVDEDSSIYAESARPSALPQVNGTESKSASSASRSGSESQESHSSVTSTESQQPANPVSQEDIYKEISQIWEVVSSRTGVNYKAFEYTGPADAKAALFTFGADAALLGDVMERAEDTDIYAQCGLITVRLYRPWFTSVLADYLPKSLERIGVLEVVQRRTTKWGPLLLDFLASLNTGSSPNSSTLVVGYRLGKLEPSTIRQALNGIFSNLKSPTPAQNLEIGSPASAPTSITQQLEQPHLENAYMKILDQLFGRRLHIANRLSKADAGLSQQITSNPEFGFGSLVARKERRNKFVKEVQTIAKNEWFATGAPKEWLLRWALEAGSASQSDTLGDEVLARLEEDFSPAAQKLMESREWFSKESQWLVGSDAWAYDLGNSGVHHVLASGENVNMLIIDSQPYSEKTAADATRRKKDIGLYAMNFGNAYVASVAVYGTYTQVLEAMIEADKFDGPSIVLAYLPYNDEQDSALVALQETKKAIDVGYWPLYRWHPAVNENDEPNFQLDSERIKKELEDFLRRDNQLTQLMKRKPGFAANLSNSYGSEVRQLQKKKARDAYTKLLEGLSGALLTILFASDNGNTEGLAKRLANRGKARGLKTMVFTMDDYPVEDLSKEDNVVLLTSTAGQGEFPQNGRAFWEAIKNATDMDLSTTHVSVFALGDSHYWPRKEDKMYYNKPGKDLHARLLALGGKQLTEIGLGDDQDPDTFQTGYAEWEPRLWQALGADNVGELPEEPPPITNEDIKIESNFLRGTIAEGLKDESTGSIAATDQQLTKFHGTYQQDDRDLRDERKAQGLEPAYSFMIRCRLPGGVATAAQWLQMDAISTSLGNQTMKLTTRQTFQFHGVIKTKLRPAMQAINKALMTTIAACGDINRNVMCSSLPQQSKFHAEVHAVSRKISDHLLPSTTAYHEIWLQQEGEKKVQVAGDAVVDHEPLYGPTYLPRKFKITIAVPPHNDTDVYAHDVGLIAIKGDDGRLQGFNILAGGGMGMTHNMKKTYPQTGRMFGYVAADQAHIVCEKIMLVQRDHGDRKNRKHARLKYTIDDMGVPAFRGEVEARWGQTFAEPRSFRFDSNVDAFGWQQDESGKHHYTFFIENGRVEDTPDFPMKTGLAEIAKIHKGAFRLTANQHLTLSDVSTADKPAIDALLAHYGLAAAGSSLSGLRASSSACVAFPTCAMAFAESERYLPTLITKLESQLAALGLSKESIVMRMTGCPNGCARPWLAEIALVGKSPGVYNLYLGGGYHGQRLNKLHRSNVEEEEILEVLGELFARYAREKCEGERFGDFVIRVGIVVETSEGRDFHENVAEGDDDDEE